MAGLLNDKMAAELGGAQPAAQPMRGEADPMADGGEQPNVTPEEQAQYDRFVDNGLKIIFDEKTAPQILKRLQASGNPIEGLASATVNVVLGLKDSAEKAGQKLDPAVLLHGGAELMENIAELSDAAGVHKFTPEELEQATYAAMDQYGTIEKERGTLDTAAFEEDARMLLEADQAGRLDELLPGITEKAKQMGGAKPQEA